MAAELLPPAAPASDAGAPPAAKEAPPSPPQASALVPANAISDVQLDEQRVKQLREYWLKAVHPHADALREAAQAHYDVLTALHREQQRLIDEADRLQRAIDELEKEYQDLTTPHPAGTEPAPADRSGTDAPLSRPARTRGCRAGAIWAVEQRSAALCSTLSPHSSSLRRRHFSACTRPAQPQGRSLAASRSRF